MPWEEVLEHEKTLRTAANHVTYDLEETTCKICTQPICCEQMFEVSPWETYLLTRAYPELITKLIPELTEQAEAEKPFHTSMEGYFKIHRRPCAFLQNGKCSIYELRPIICATMHIKKGEPVCGEMGESDKHLIGFLPEFTYRYLLASKTVWEQNMRPALREQFAVDIPFGMIPGLATAISHIGDCRVPPYVPNRTFLDNELPPAVGK